MATSFISLPPGLRSGLTGNWPAYASIGLPVVTDLNGTQAEPDYRIIAGISRVF